MTSPASYEISPFGRRSFMSSIGSGKNSPPTPPPSQQMFQRKIFFKQIFRAASRSTVPRPLSLFEVLKSKSEHLKFPFPIELQDDQRFIFPDLGIVLAYKKIPSKEYMLWLKIPITYVLPVSFQMPVHVSGTKWNKNQRSISDR